MRLVAILACMLVPVYAQDLQKEARAALARTDFEGAAKLAKQLIASAPDSDQGWALLAQADLGRNQPEAALEDLRRALRLNPSSADALYFQAKLASIRSQQEFGAVVQAAPDSGRAHQIMAEILVRQQKLDEAEREYKAALARKPGDAAILIQLGDTQRENHGCNRAEQSYAEVLRRDATNYDAAYGMGACRMRSNDRVQAVKWFRQALKVDPSSAAASMALGDVLLANGDARAALPLLERAAAVDPNVRRLQLLLAKAYRATGNDAAANQSLAKVRELADSERKAERIEDEGPQ